MRPLTPERIEETLQTATEGFLGLVGDDGDPRVTPVWYVKHGDEIWMSSVTTREKVDQLRNHPQAAFAVHQRIERRNCGVQLRGPVRVEAELADEVARLLCERYRPDSMESCLAYFGTSPRVALIMAIEHTSSWS